MSVMDVRPGFDPTLVGKRAECDGGGMTPGGRYATRQEFKLFNYATCLL